MAERILDLTEVFARNERVFRSGARAVESGRAHYVYATVAVPPNPLPRRIPRPPAPPAARAPHVEAIITELRRSGPSALRQLLGRSEPVPRFLPLFPFVPRPVTRRSDVLYLPPDWYLVSTSGWEAWRRALGWRGIGGWRHGTSSETLVVTKRASFLLQFGAELADYLQRRERRLLREMFP